jgi:hypothetical protein
MLDKHLVYPLIGGKDPDCGSAQWSAQSSAQPSAQFSVKLRVNLLWTPSHDSLLLRTYNTSGLSGGIGSFCYFLDDPLRTRPQPIQSTAFNLTLDK